MDLTENTKAFDAEQITKEAIEIAEKNAKLDPVLIASSFFTNMYPNFSNLVSQCNNKDLKRICRNMVGWPLLANEEPNLHSKQAKDAWKLGAALMQARQIMIMNAQLHNIEKENNSGAEKTETQGENNNGLET